jgi:hypothetical protein
LIMKLTGSPHSTWVPVAAITAVLVLGFILPGLLAPWVMRRRMAAPPNAAVAPRLSRLVVAACWLLTAFVTVRLSMAVIRMLVDFYSNPAVVGQSHPPLMTRMANWCLLNHEIAWLVGVVAAFIVTVLIMRVVMRALRKRVAATTHTGTHQPVASRGDVWCGVGAALCFVMAFAVAPDDVRPAIAAAQTRLSAVAGARNAAIAEFKSAPTDDARRVAQEKVNELSRALDNRYAELRAAALGPSLWNLFWQTSGWVLVAIAGIRWVMRWRMAAPPISQGSVSTSGTGIKLLLTLAITVPLALMILIKVANDLPVTLGWFPVWVLLAGYALIWLLPWIVGIASGRDSARWYHVMALAGVWWFASMPVIFWVADIPRIQNTQWLALMLLVVAAPVFVGLAARALRRWQTMPNGARWLRAWSWVGLGLAVPAVGFAAFFIHAAATESGGWHPSPNEKWAVPLIMLAALSLPSFAAGLWNAAGGGKKGFICMAMSAIAAITVVVLGMSGGMAARPWLLQHKQQQAFKVHIAPEAVEGRVVIVRVFTPDPNHGREMRMVLEGPDDDPEHRTIPSGFFKRQPRPDVFVFPSPTPAKQPWTDFGSAKQTLVAFVLPTEELAKEAYRKLGSGPLEFGRVQPPGAFLFDLDPSKPETMTCRLFQVADGTGPSYTGSLMFSAGLIREGHPRWVEVRSRGCVDSNRNLEYSWEISTSRPAAVMLRHRTKEGGGETMDVCDLPTGTTKTYQQKINLLLYKISDTRVGMRLMNGTQPNTREFDGDFDAIARELEPLQTGGTWKTERDWDIELCRVAGNPVILRVEGPPPPTVVEKETKPLGSDDPRWVEITYQGDKKNPPFAIGPQKLPGFHRFLWLLRASRPGLVKVAGPYGPPLIAPLEKSDESGLYEALYAVELVAVDERTTEVRRVLGPQKDAIQVAAPYEELSQRVKESACSTNPARETESMLHRYGPVTSPMVTAIITDRPLEAAVANTAVAPVPEERLWQLLPGDLEATPEVSDGIFGKLTDGSGQPMGNRAVLFVAKPTQGDGGGLARAVTKSDGSFTVELPPSEIFQIFVLRGDGGDKNEVPDQAHAAFVGIPRGDRDKGALNLRFDGQKVEARFELLLWGESGKGARKTKSGSPEEYHPDASIEGRLLDAQGKPVRQRVLRVLNPVMEPTHQQPQVFAETLTAADGSFHITLPVGKPFVVVLPADGSNAEARGKQLIISFQAGPEGRTVDLIHGEMEVKINGAKLEAHFRRIREIPDSTTPPAASPTAPAQGQPATEKE